MAETKKQGKAKSKPRPGAKAKAKAKPKAKAKAKPGAKAKASAKAKKPKKPKAAKPQAAPEPKEAPEAKEAPEPKGAEPEEAATDTAEDAVGAAQETPVGAGANAALAGKAALAGTRAAGHALGVAASKVKGPIVVGGGLAAGAVGGLALVRRRNGSRSTGTLDVERVIEAARRAGSFGEELGRMASLMEQANAGSKRKRK
jgi:hypothetical protein